MMLYIFLGTAASLLIICVARNLLSNSYVCTEDLDGKTVIVTGANSGIGWQVAVKLARQRAKVILACRNETKGKQAEADIRRSSGNDLVFFKQLNLASFESILSFAKTIKSEEREIYALVNNAGIFWVPFQKTVDGFETNFGVNYLGHFLLTIYLLPLLNSSSHSRVVTVSSVMHLFGRIRLGNLQHSRDDYNFVTAYSDSKLMGISACKQLAKQLLHSNIKFYSADPGICFTEIGKDSMFMGGFVFRILLAPVVAALFKSASQGADTVVYCTTAPELANNSGEYYSGCQVSTAALGKNAMKTGELLLRESAKLCGLKEFEMQNYLT